jgi:hypothetical protein
MLARAAAPVDISDMAEFSSPLAMIASIEVPADLAMSCRE